MLIHAHSLSFYVFFIWGSHWGCSWDRGPIGDPRVGVPIGAAPGSGFPLGGLWSGPLGPLGPWDPPRPLGLGDPPRPLGLGDPPRSLGLPRGSIVAKKVKIL